MEKKTTRKYAKSSNRIPSYTLKLVKEREVVYADRISLRSPMDVVKFIRPYYDEVASEEVHAIYLNTGHQIIGHKVISVGGIASSIIDPIMVISPGFLMCASAIILVHNHPSGNPEPSREDIKVTTQMKEVGRLCNLPLRDHIILADESFTSMAERGHC